MTFVEGFVRQVAAELGWMPWDISRHAYSEQFRVSFCSNREQWRGELRSGSISFNPQRVAMHDTQELRHIATQVRRIIRPEGEGVESFFPRFPI